MKRKRTEGPITSSQIAESNRTLQILAGRHNRWMSADTRANGDGQTTLAGEHEASRTDGHSSAVTSNAPPASHVNRSTQSEAGTDTVPPTNGMHVTSGRARQVQERPPSTATTSSNARPPPRTASPLVQYEAPPSIAMDDFATAAIPNLLGSTGRKSVDSMARQTAQPSLPSPASSDDSPTLPAQALRRVRTPRNSLGGIATTSRSMANSPILQHQPSPLQNNMQLPTSISGHPAPHPPPTPPAHQMSHPSHAHRPSWQQQQHQPQQNHVVPTHRHSLPNGVQVQPGQGSNQPLRTPPIVPSNVPSARQLAASRIPAADLLRQLDRKEAEMRQSGTISPTDSGRIVLLREAVQKNDWFYQVLSQLFCLRTVSPMLLPQSLRDVNSKCWDYLDVLICPNNTLDDGLVQFFAHFPESIMAIYSDRSDARDIFDLRVQSVKVCLNKLPNHWDNFVRACKKMSAPPMIQDLYDILDLKTPVLQSTAFRAISRMLYGNTDLDSKGVQAIEQFHLLDQDSYYRYNYRRSPAEMKEAYSVLTSVFQAFQSWKSYLQTHPPLGPLPDFQPPTAAVEYFRRPLSSMGSPQQPAQPHRPSLQHQQPQAAALSHQQRLQVQAQAINQQQGVQAQFQAVNGRSSSMLPQHMLQMPPQLAQLAALGAQLQAGRLGVQSPVTPAPPRESRLLFPRAEDQPRPQPTNPEWTRSGLHQTHLRSPCLGPTEHTLGAPQLYRHVIGFSVPPTRLKKGVLTQAITFSISQESMDRVAKTDAPRTIGAASYRRILDTSLLYRLRCSAVPRGGFQSEAAWVTTDNIWPEEMYFELNGTKLETRRKLHHGRYLPIDLTAFIRLGENKLRVSRARNKNDYRVVDCALAVEVIGVMTHDSIKDQIPRISATESLSAIKKSLAGAGGDDDDEVAVTSSALTIKLFDPYSGCKIFDIPARGKDCLHRDCFDLETFLQMCKRQHPGWPSVVDCWRCPLCRGDVRPQTLIIDEFLVEARRELGKKGLLNTREIIVNADGSWKPKAEERTGVRSPSLEREERGSMARSVSAAAPAQAIEVIEID